MLAPLAAIADDVLLTSVSNVGLWAHKARDGMAVRVIATAAHCVRRIPQLESNTCIHSHREAGLETGSHFVATASPAVKDEDGQVTLNGYFISATTKVRP